MDKTAFILSLIGLGLDILIIVWQTMQERERRKTDRKNELTSTLQNRIDEYSNMTTSVIFAQLSNLYQELSIMLFKNYANIIDLILTPNPEVTEAINNDYSNMVIKIEAYSYIFKSELNALLFDYKKTAEKILDCIENKHPEIEYPPQKETDKLYNLYKQIKNFFKTDLENIQTDIDDILKDFAKEYARIDNNKATKTKNC